MSMRAAQKEERNKQILFSALDLFTEKGYQNTKITDIAKAANMSTGLLFHYYESKEALYEALIDIGLQGAQSAMQIEVDMQNPLLFFAEAAKGVLNALAENSFYAKIFILMANAIKGGAPEHIRHKAAKINNIEMCVPLIKAGQKLGQIKQGDALSLSFAFWASIQGVAENHQIYPKLLLPKAEWLVDIIKA